MKISNDSELKGSNFFFNSFSLNLTSNSIFFYWFWHNFQICFLTYHFDFRDIKRKSVLCFLFPFSHLYCAAEVSLRNAIYFSSLWRLFIIPSQMILCDSCILPSGPPLNYCYKAKAMPFSRKRKEKEMDRKQCNHQTRTSWSSFHGRRATD